MKLNEYQGIVRRNDSGDQALKKIDAVFDLFNGSAKLAIKYKKIMDGDVVSHIPLLLEIGDVLKCVARCASAFGYTLEQVAKENINLKEGSGM